MNLTPHFTMAEFDRASSGDFTEADALRMAILLESLRAAGGGVPLRVNSFTRSHDRNLAVGGVETSDHLTASAADVTPLMDGPADANIRQWATKVLIAEAEGQLVDYGQFIIYPGAGDHAHISFVGQGHFRDKLVKTSPEPGADPVFGKLALASVGLMGSGVVILLAGAIVVAAATRKAST